ncbi:MAG: hypothetical protein AB1668_00365 [Nanoarchaeota archaeon]
MESSNGLYITGASGGDRFFYRVAEALKKDMNINPFYIATIERNEEYLLSRGVPKKNIIGIYYTKEHFTAPTDLNFLHQKEEEYGFRFWDFWEVTAMRKKKRDKIQKEKILFWFEYLVCKFEEIVEKIKPKYFFVYGPAGFHILIMYAIAKKKGIKILDFTASPIHRRFTLMDSLNCSWPLIEKEYKKILKNGFSKEEKSAAWRFIQNYRNSPIVPTCRRKYNEPFPKKVKRYIYYARYIIKKRELPIITNRLLWPAKKLMFNSINFFEKPIKNEKYVLFNLHFQPEISTSLYGKWFADQPYVIEQISKSLPLNYMLYVKEHPFGYGNRKLNFYKRIRRLRNVRLIDPTENNFQLIKHASLIITITGTSGWEGLIFGKRVITFGNTYYNLCKEVKHLRASEDLPQTIKESLDKKVDEKEIIKFVAAMFRGTFPGLAWLPGDCAEQSTEKKNVLLIAEGVKKYILKE